MASARLIALLAVACGSCARGPAEMSFGAPESMRYALTVAEVVRDLGATAELVARSGERQPRVDLARGADQVSFSGFIAAEPGDYTLEIAFSGVRIANTSRVFLGRLTSDAFTISRGATAEPRFSQPLDTIGRPEDRGDDDQDRLGMLDELLFGADPERGDTDGDGLGDGEDCDPDQAARATKIASGGSTQDCDADGARRSDLGFAPGGTDCDDRDAAIRPGATDDCMNAVDEDCNPATCPVDDREGPSISGMVPEDGATVGCQTTIQATIRDNGTVGTVTAVLDDPPPGGRDTLYLTRTSADSDAWVSEPFDNASGSEGFPEGQHRVVIRAIDFAGNETTEERTYNFAFDFVRITSMTPADVGTRSDPFEVTVEVTSVHGLRSVALYAAPRSMSGGYALSGAIMIGMVAASPARFTVDPSSFAAGEYLLYPLAEDLAGNKTTLTGPTLYPSQGQVLSYYRCIASPSSGYMMPVRVMVVGGAGGYTPATTGEHLDEAIALAAATDPGARFVKIIAYGLQADGRIDLDDGMDYLKRIEYSFYNSTTRQWLTVTWFTPAWMMNNPVVMPNAGNVTSEEAITDPSAILDSPAFAQKVDMSPTCDAPAGTASDWLLITQTDGTANAAVYLLSGEYWYGTATAPLTTLRDCD